jgi:hypothetical protein
MTQKTEATKKDTLTSGDDVTEFTTTLTTHVFSPDTTYTTTDTGYVRESGDYVLSYSSLSDTTPDTAFVTAPKANQTWTSGDATYLVVGQEDVTVTAGTFKKAWKLQFTPSDTTMKVYLWFADGKGNVKEHMEFSPTSGVSVVYNNELTSATIK